MITVSKVSHHTYLHVSDSRTIISEFFWWDVRRDAAMIETLNGTHETVNYRENTNLRIYDNTQFEDYPTHWHSPIEIIMPVQNNYRIEYCDQTLSLREGDVMILCPGVLHHLFPAEGRRYIIQAEINPALNLREVDLPKDRRPCYRYHEGIQQWSPLFRSLHLCHADPHSCPDRKDPG